MVHKKVKTKKISIKVIGILIIVFLSVFLVIGLLVQSINDSDPKDSLQKETESKEVVGWIEYSKEECIDLCDYKNMSVTIDIPEVITDEDMIMYINHVLKNYPLYDELEQKIVKESDCLFIDISGVLENEKNPCVESKDEVVILGKSNLLKEIQDSLIGKHVGDNIQVKYTYPDNFADKEYSGKTIIFSVTVKGIYSQKFITYDDLNDEYAKNVLGCRSLDEFISQIKTEMYGIISEYEKTAIEDAVINKIMATTSYRLPEELYEQKFEQEKQLFINIYCSGDESIYEKQLYNYTSLSESEYRKNNYDDFKEYVNYELAASLIMEKENFSMNEYDSFLDQQMESYNCSSKDKLYEMLTTDFETGEDYLKRQYCMYVVTEYLTNNARVERTADASVTKIVFGSK